jgi:hypothetical protein
VTGKAETLGGYSPVHAYQQKAQLIDNQGFSKVGMATAIYLAQEQEKHGTAQ